MVACDTPSDYRPGRKVSVDYVPPGERSTYNVSDAGDEPRIMHDTHRTHDTKDAHGQETMINHDEHMNEIGTGEGVADSVKANVADSVESHQ
ncbi:MAG: hypothetical protein LPK01_09780 [Hymenobacteraceae bacterium]|nr:hypothetical protein [Hymenobacteraceae bacterium]